MVFCLVVRGVYPPYTLSGPTTKTNTFFMCVFPKGPSYNFIIFDKFPVLYSPWGSNGGKPPFLVLIASGTR